MSEKIEAKMIEDATMVRADYEGLHHMRADNSFGLIDHTDKKIPIGFTVKITKKEKTRERRYPIVDEDGNFGWSEPMPETYYTGYYYYGDDNEYWYGEGGLWFDDCRQLIDTDGDVSLTENHVVAQMIRLCGFKTDNYFTPRFTRKLNARLNKENVKSSLSGSLRHADDGEE
ncbi:MAG: hypothetical protein CMC15_13850 [Flavobacteriaceae bacterium]|nr:hypothetical protein [Flavobacteriaceae bacterium]|tara:strand:+ start:1217 stop:1732 length:516 start_codon:yes stop_codon:yes gene_type:complete